MAVAVVYSFPKSAIAVYDRHLALAGERLTNQPARRAHVCFETNEDYTVVDVWDSAEEFEAFGEVLAEVAREDHSAEGEPKLAPLHITIHRLHNVIV
jgi:heme-degrading monooxygenase HmoA